MASLAADTTPPAEGLALGNDVKEQGEEVELTDEQKAERTKQFLEKVEHLKAEHKAQVECEFTVLRFLSGKGWDVDVAVDQFTKAMAWRKELKIDTIVEDYKTSRVPEIADWWPRGFKEGVFDADGDPIIFERLGEVDVEKVMKMADDDEVVRYVARNLEATNEYQTKHSKEIGRLSRYTFIQDIGGLGRKHMFSPGIDLFGRVIGMSSIAYPEALKQLFVIRAPTIFVLVWALVGQFFDANTRRKIQILGSDYIQQLEKFGVTADKIPKAMGGTLVDSNGDPDCQEWMCKGGVVPDDYWKTRGMTELFVSKLERLAVPYKKKGTVIEWRMHVLSGDIDYIVSDGADGDDGKEVAKPGRVWRSFGKFTSERDEGVLHFIFDNSFSWINSKTVRYKIIIDGQVWEQ